MNTFTWKILFLRKNFLRLACSAGEEPPLHKSCRSGDEMQGET